MGSRTSYKNKKRNQYKSDNANMSNKNNSEILLRRKFKVFQSIINKLK